MKREPRQRLWSAAASDPVLRASSIPKGLRPPAQGCDSSRRSQAKVEERATLGKTFRDRTNPERVVPRASQIRRSILMLLPLAILSPRMAEADAGFVRLREAQGPFVVTVFTPFQVCHSTPIDISLMVQRRDTGELVLDATVDLHLVPPAGGVIQTTDPVCTSSNQAMLNALSLTTNNSLTVRALRAGASAQFLYAVQILFPTAGDWQLQASIREGEQGVNIAGPLPVGSPAGRLGSLWPFLAFPPLVIALFVINQCLQRRRIRTTAKETVRRLDKIALSRKALPVGE